MDSGPAQPVPPAARKSFWQSLLLFERAKLNLSVALRNTLGVTIPLAAGAAAGAVTSGLVVATGALNVAFRDSASPYPQRARHLLAASLIAGIAVFCGAVTGSNAVLAVIVTGLWAFAAGMLVALSQAAADLGLMSVVMLVVYGANPMSPPTAALAGAGALAGGLLQTLLSLALWPIRRYAPERRALGVLYLELSHAALSPQDHAAQSPPATAQSLQAQTSLATLDRDGSAEGARYRFLLSQAERIRLSLIALGRLRFRLERSAGGDVSAIDRFLQICGRALASIGTSIQAGEPAGPPSADLAELDRLAEHLREPPKSAEASAIISDARFQMDAILGQLRSAVDLAGPASLAPAVPQRDWRLRVGGTFATLRANLNFESAAFRHAVRLSVAVMAGDALGRALGFVRPYWIPMTIAIVLKPDFSATFNRGVLRLLGTFAGLVFATALFHVLPPSVNAQIAVIAVLMFIVRYLGPAQYGVLTAAVGALVVFLISLTGVSPKEAIAARALNTAIGGAIALAIYWIWPTWERGQVSEALARMLDAFHDYFHQVRESYRRPAPHIALDSARIVGRRARTNLEASIERTLSEPGISPDRTALLAAILASSHRLTQALMSLEAAIVSSSPATPRAPFSRFADDVELSLVRLAALLRGSPVDPASLPDLREDHHALLHAGDSGAAVYALVNVETDRITNSLNTLAADVIRWAASR